MFESRAIVRSRERGWSIARWRWLLLAFWGLPVFATSAWAQDWPTYMHDNARSGVTTVELKLPLARQWGFKSSVAPRPAWPPPQKGWTELPKVDFDDCFYTVADDQRVYFGSSVDHSFSALDLARGELVWQYFTDSPVRLAPVIAGERVVGGSDDGRVYCLERQSGKLQWAYQAAAQERTVIGNGQMTSLWPVRTGLAVEGDAIFGGCGVFPFHGVSLFALDLATGRPKWRNEAIKSYGGFSPQGYLLTASGGALLVPSGRAPPVCLDQETGALRFEIPRVGDKGGATGTYGVVVGQSLFVGTQNTLYGIHTATGQPAGRWNLADRIIALPEQLIVLKGAPAPGYGRRSSTKHEILCYDRAKYQTLPAKTAEALASALQWKLARPELGSMIAAGRHLVIGGRNEVMVVDLATGTVEWETAVDGLVMGLTAAHGRLLVSTTTGAIECFAAAPAPAGVGVPSDVNSSSAARRASADASPTDVDLAQRIVQVSQRSAGWALLIGPGADRLACRLAESTELTLVCLLPDEAATAAARRLIASHGWYGARVSAHAIPATGWKFADYAADLVVDLREHHAQTATVLQAQLSELPRVLKPCGGVLLVTRPGVASNPSQAGLSESKAVDQQGNSAWSEILSAWQRRGIEPLASTSAIQNESWFVYQAGELPGSGWWSHQYANAGNSGSSGDDLVRGRLEVLWFGEPGADEFPDRHQRSSAPLVVGGRVICQGWNFLEKSTSVFCFDAYNGRRLWKQTVDGSPRLGLPAVPGNLASDGRSVFIACGSRCTQFDLETGRLVASYQTPPRADGSLPDWGYLGLADGRLVGSAGLAVTTGYSDVLFAFDTTSHVRRWQVNTAELRDTTLCLAEGRLHYAENRQPRPPAQPGDRPKFTESAEANTPQLLAWVITRSLADGQVIWQREIDLTDCGNWRQSSWGTLQALCQDDVLIFAGAYTIYPSKAPPRPRRAVALAASSGRSLWSNEIANRSRPLIMQGELLSEPVFFDLQTGEKIVRQVGKTTKMAPWSIGPRTGGCGSLSASECMVFGRGGYTVWRDVTGGGSAAFIGTRPGCFINIIPAGGVVVQAEASSGCSCYQAVQCTVVLRPAWPAATTSSNEGGQTGSAGVLPSQPNAPSESTAPRAVKP